MLEPYPLRPDGDHWSLDVVGASIHRASEEDLDQAVEILEEVSRWAVRAGVRAWEQGAFTAHDGRGRHELIAALAAGDLYLARMNGDAAATVSLFERDDRYWPKAPEDALYVHKLAVARRFAGRDLGGAIMRWAAELTRSRGKAFLRLNCLRDEPGIRRYYEEAGFAYRGDVTVGDFRAALYEAPV